MGKEIKMGSISKKTVKRNRTITITIIIMILLIIGGVIAILVFSKIAGPNDSTKPDTGVAKAVCEKHGGQLKTEEKADSEYELAVSCTNATESPDLEHIDKVFLFEVYYLKKDSTGGRLEKARSSLIGDSPYYKVLENSDDFIKVYAASSNDYGTKYDFATFYGDTMAMVITFNAPLAEDLLAELGFPDRGRAETYEVTIEDTANNE